MKISYSNERLIGFLNSEAVMPQDLNAQKTLQTCADNWIEYLRHRAISKRALEDTLYADWEYQATGRLFARLNTLMKPTIACCTIRFSPFTLKMDWIEGKLVKVHSIQPEMPFLILPDYGYHFVRFAQLIADPIGLQLMRCSYCGRFAIGKNLAVGPQRFCPTPADCAKKYDNQFHAPVRMKDFRQKCKSQNTLIFEKEKNRMLAEYAKVVSGFNKASRRKDMWTLYWKDWNQQDGKKYGSFSTPEEFELAAMKALNNKADLQGSFPKVKKR